MKQLLTVQQVHIDCKMYICKFVCDIAETKLSTRHETGLVAV